MTPSEKLLFVYGTLKRGGANHQFLAGQEYVGEARTVPGFRLYELGGYPGLVPQADDRAGVTGEIWSVSPPALRRLDALEGLSEGHYRRAVIPLLPPFANQGIEGYLYNLSVEGRRAIGTTWRE